jgi:hypothetical protein
VTLGETVRAFDVKGKALQSKDVLKALAEPKLVAVFVRQLIAQPRDLSDPALSSPGIKKHLFLDAHDDGGVLGVLHRIVHIICTETPVLHRNAQNLHRNARACTETPKTCTETVATQSR